MFPNRVIAHELDVCHSMLPFVVFSNGAGQAFPILGVTFSNHLPFNGVGPIGSTMRSVASLRIQVDNHEE
jgi:hypothetical protein